MTFMKIYTSRLSQGQVMLFGPIAKANQSAPRSLCKPDTCPPVYLWVGLKPVLHTNSYWSGMFCPFDTPTYKRGKREDMLVFLKLVARILSPRLNGHAVACFNHSLLGFFLFHYFCTDFDRFMLEYLKLKYRVWVKQWLDLLSQGHIMHLTSQSGKPADYFIHILHKSALSFLFLLLFLF